MRASKKIFQTSCPRIRQRTDQPQAEAGIKKHFIFQDSGYREHPVARPE
jgi:hypothetical protein